MSCVNSQSWKQNYSGLLRHDFAITATVVRLIWSSSQSRRRRHSCAHPIASSKSRESTPPCTVPPWPFSFLPDLNAWTKIMILGAFVSRTLHTAPNFPDVAAHHTIMPFLAIAALSLLSSSRDGRAATSKTAGLAFLKLNNYDMDSPFWRTFRLVGESKF